jgi:hypothetical protein
MTETPPFRAGPTGGKLSCAETAQKIGAAAGAAVAP